MTAWPVAGGSLRRRHWTDAPWCVVDVETTGLDLRRDDVVSFGAVAVESGRVRAATATYGLVRPATTPSARSIEVHALLPAALADAPPRADAAAQVAGLLRGHVLVAHAAWVERAFLGRLLREAGVRLRGPVVDTAALARAAGVAPRLSRTEPPLERLAQVLGVPPHTPHHALGDALTTAAVFVVLATRLSRETPQTVGSLARLSKAYAAGR